MTGYLAILEKDEAMCTEKSEPQGFMRLNAWVGERKLLHCTGFGKALLMHSPPYSRQISQRPGFRVFPGDSDA